MIGNNRETSTSKIKKRIASKKNFIQKGSRGDINESNPHSNVVSFSQDCGSLNLNPINMINTRGSIIQKAL
jgi:hypothetical protein